MRKPPQNQWPAERPGVIILHSCPSSLFSPDFSLTFWLVHAWGQSLPWLQNSLLWCNCSGAERGAQAELRHLPFLQTSLWKLVLCLGLAEIPRMMYWSGSFTVDSHWFFSNLIPSFSPPRFFQCVILVFFFFLRCFYLILPCSSLLSYTYYFAKKCTKACEEQIFWWGYYSPPPSRHPKTLPALAAQVYVILTSSISEKKMQ